MLSVVLLPVVFYSFKVGFCSPVTSLFGALPVPFSAMCSSGEVVDLEAPTFDDNQLLRKHVDSALPSVPLMAAAPVHTSTSLMNDAPPSSAASASKDGPNPVASLKKPDMFIKFQVSDQLKKFMAKPEKDRWGLLCCAFFLQFLLCISVGAYLAAGDHGPAS